MKKIQTVKNLPALFDQVDDVSVDIDEDSISIIPSSPNVLSRDTIYDQETRMENIVTCIVLSFISVAFVSAVVVFALYVKYI